MIHKVITAGVLILTYQFIAYSQELPKGSSIVENVNKRNEGKQLIQTISLELTDKRGKKRNQELEYKRKDVKGKRNSMILYSSPVNVKGTSFLTYDYDESGRDDDQWLYLPALRKTRRISAAKRGDYFLGTDLTYQDIKKSTKIETSDFIFKALKRVSVEERECYLVEAIPLSEKISKELGYSKVHFYIDSEIYMPRKMEYWDTNGNSLKTFDLKSIKKVQGVWTPHLFEIENHKTDHKTKIVFDNSDYQKAISDDDFTQEAMIREN